MKNKIFNQIFVRLEDGSRLPVRQGSPVVEPRSVGVETTTQEVGSQKLEVGSPVVEPVETTIQEVRRDRRQTRNQKPET